MDLRTYVYLDVLQPQLAGFLQTVCSGFPPREGQASLFVETAPGIAINIVTDVALKATKVVPGMQIVEREFGLLELHHFDQGQVRAAGEAILSQLDVKLQDRFKPKIVSSRIITGITGYQAQHINRIRHGDMIVEGQSLYTLECFPAGYASIAANEAEKGANIHLLEVITFGAYGRLWLGGSEEEINSARDAAERALNEIQGQEAKY
jgi:hypothetical protein